MNKIIEAVIDSIGSHRKFSLEANLAIYTNKTITPPIKIRNNTNPYHGEGRKIIEIKQIVIV